MCLFCACSNIETHTVLLYSVSWACLGLVTCLAAAIRQLETCCDAIHSGAVTTRNTVNCACTGHLLLDDAERWK